VADRASLEAEQQFLLTSLDDLESEFAAGDISKADFEQLKADYTIRTARVARRLNGLSSQPLSAEGSTARRLGWIAGVTLFGVVIGLLLAQFSGERGVNDNITGSIEESPRQQVFRCQSMGAEGQLLASFECFDDVLARDPENAQALGYRGWYGVLASGSAQAAGQDEAAAELLAVAGVNLDRAVEADPTYPDARAFRMIVLERLGRNDDACDDAQVLLDLNPPAQILQLTTPVIDRLGC
jgi:tetratricopeptide (TPR) repeat protein